MLKIVIAPHPLLTSPSAPVKPLSRKIQKIITEMEETLRAQVNPQGVGLAAPQVGYTLSLFIIKTAKQAPIEIFINPTILETKNSNPSTSLSSSKDKDPRHREKKTKLEGCLSIPKIWSPIQRAKKIFLSYQTPDGQKKTDWFSGFKATIIQHEIDHLNGILFTQRAIEQNVPLYEEIEGKLEKIQY